MSPVDNNATALTVAKFGGTSVADFTAMSRSAAIIKQNPAARIILISACSGVTNLLVELANGVNDSTRRQQLLARLKEIHHNVISELKSPESVLTEVNSLLDSVSILAKQAATQPSIPLTDQLVSHGELLSTHLFSQILNEMDVDTIRFDIRNIMRTDSQFGKAIPQPEMIRQLAATELQPLLENQVVVSQGFIGSDSEGKTTTLGRGGSDYSAALVLKRQTPRHWKSGLMCRVCTAPILVSPRQPNPLKRSVLAKPLKWPTSEQKSYTPQHWSQPFASRSLYLSVPQKLQKKVGHGSVKALMKRRYFARLPYAATKLWLRSQA